MVMQVSDGNRRPMMTYLILDPDGKLKPASFLENYGNLRKMLCKILEMLRRPVLSQYSCKHMPP